ncbi:MAG: hypothetical protein LQ340_006392 [Diploschistes diacapsis]|nr:MAG: hypothetical protein LQ340_006392 [Diploschistes diacapsis]
MALSPTGEGYVAASGADDSADPALPIFDVQKVQLQFSLSAEFVAAQVANNVLILALATGRILRIDLDNAEDIDDIDLPKKSSETGPIRRLFLDPSASHLIINTNLGENYYLHTQSRQPKPLSRLKGVAIESVAWNPSLPTASTREILIGAADGNVYEAFIEPSTEFYRSQEKYVKSVLKLSDGPIVGVWADVLESRPDVRRVFIATPSRLLHVVGRVSRHGSEGSGVLYAKLFENERPTIQYGPDEPFQAPSALVISPDVQGGSTSSDSKDDKAFAWLSSSTVRYGSLLSLNDTSILGSKMMNASKIIERSKIPPSESASGRKRPSRDPITAIALSQWHVLCFVEGRIVAINRLSQEIVYDQTILGGNKTALGLVADQKKGTLWLFTAHEIFEIAIGDEDRDIWKIMLKEKRFDAALQFARGPSQKDAVATASGDYLVKKGQFLEAASVYGRSSKAFEEVALTFVDNDQQDALRKIL